MSTFNSFFNRGLIFLRLKKRGDELTCTPLHESRFFWDFQIFNIADHNSDAWHTRLYYVFYRFFKYNPWGNPRQAYREVKWFIQRGRRGYADCDVWSLDHYINGWMPDALRRLKATKQGVPCTLIEEADCDEHGSTSDEGLKRAEERWNVILDQMIEGFEADKRYHEGLYEDELGAYPLDRPTGFSAHAWEKVKKDRRVASEALMERDKKLSEEGRALFTRFYHNLWD